MGPSFSGLYGSRDYHIFYHCPKRLDGIRHIRESKGLKSKYLLFLRLQLELLIELYEV